MRSVIATLRAWAFWLPLITAAQVACLPPPAYAFDHGWDHNDPVVQWFESLQEPDTGGSCCGKSDVYEADRYVDQGDHYDVWITDGSERTYPDGTKRKFVPDGTYVRVPSNKVNPPKDGNPTKHAWIYMSVYDKSAAAYGGAYGAPMMAPIPGTDEVIGSVYCFVPLPPSF